MRTFCLLLILANALYFIWSQVLDVHVNGLDRGPAMKAGPPPRIVLAREAIGNLQAENLQADESAARHVMDITSMAEVPSGEMIERPLAAIRAPDVESLAARSAGSNETVPPDAMACTTVGPFADLPQASQAQAALRAAGFRPRQRLEEGELWVGYWVSIQGFPAREAAEEALRTLTANGVMDVYIMPSSETATSNALSLGVFSDYQRARRRVEQIRGLGMEPRIEDRKRSGTVYWLDVDLAEPGQRIDSSVFQTDPGKITRLEMAACPSAGEG